MTAARDGRLVLGMSCLALLAAWPAARTLAQASDRAGAPLVGAWTLSTELSDTGAAGGPETPQGDDDGRRGDRGGGGGRGGFRGGFGGGGGRRGGDGRGGAMDREAMARMRNAMRDLSNPPDHLIVVDTGTTIVLTGPDGRTTRLSPDGRNIKDENTGIERKTKWDGALLVSEISGAIAGKMTQTFAVDPERHHLTISLQRDGGSGQPRIMKKVYVADAR